MEVKVEVKMEVKMDNTFVCNKTFVLFYSPFNSLLNSPLIFNYRHTLNNKGRNSGCDLYHFLDRCVA